VKAIFAALLFSLALWPTGAAAQILLDGFLNDTSEVTAPAPPSSEVTLNIDGTQIDRQISVEAADNFSIVSQVLDGVFVVDAGGVGSGSANVQVEYLGFVFDIGPNTFFQFSTNRVIGTPEFGLILTDAALGQLSGAILLSPVATATTFTLDITSFAGYTPGFGSALNGVTVFIGDANEAFFAEGNSFEFSPVPEPATLLLAALGALVILWRRGFGNVLRLRRGR